MKTRYRSAVLDERRQTSPDAGLWAAVLGQAFSDALCRVSEGSNTTPDDVQRARRWLLFDREDFRWVCEAAGIVPSAVRRKAQQYASCGWADEVAT